MNGWLQTLKNVALLDTPTFEALLERKDIMKRGILTLLACFILAGSIAAVVNYASSVRRVTGEQAEQIQQQVEQSMQMFEQSMSTQDPAAAEFMQQFMSNFTVGMRMGMEIDNLESPLPRGLARLLAALGGWVSGAFSHLGTWLGYSIWVLLFAKWLGGAGDIKRFLGLTALYAVPNVLSIFSPAPIVGGLIAFIGWVWGLIVYVKGVQVSQRLTTGKAIAAVVLPALILFVLASLGSIISFVTLLAAAGQG